MLHIQLAALALASTALAVSGCGSSKTGSTTTAASTTTPTATAITTSTVSVATGKPLTRAQLIAKGDAICAITNTKRLGATASSKAELVRTLPQLALYNGEESESLSKLVPPASMAHDWTLIVNDLHLYGEYANSAAQYAKENQEKTAGHQYEKAIKLIEQVMSTGRRDGFKYCSLAR
jgi:hypothetical protein